MPTTLSMTWTARICKEVAFASNWPAIRVIDVEVEVEDATLVVAAATTAGEAILQVPKLTIEWLLRTSHPGLLGR